MTDWVVPMTPGVDLEVSKLKSTPTDEELASEIERAEMAVCVYL